MLSKFLSAATVALAASRLVSAQTSSKCNPVKGDKCPADKAAPPTTNIDFTKGESDFFTSADGTALTYDPKNGGVFKIEKESDAPTLTSKSYIFYGKVDVWVKASVGTGVVTSFVLQSDDLDEIDWEWLGGDATQVQTNYFSKGDTTTYDRSGFSPVSNPQNEWHKYTIDWTNTTLTWLIDDKPARVLTYQDAKSGATFPQTPMQIKIGTWDAGRKDAPKGTVEWAGGYTDFSQAPFLGYYKQLNIINYSNGVKGASEYSYGDNSGTSESIKIKTGGSTGGDDSSSSSSSSKPTSTGGSDSSSSSSSKTKSSKPSQTTLSGSVSPTGSNSPTSTGGSSSSSGSGSPTGSGQADSSPTPTANSAGKAVVGAAALFGLLAL